MLKFRFFLILIIVGILFFSFNKKLILADYKTDYPAYYNYAQNFLGLGGGALLHGAYSVVTADDINQAAKLGATYVMAYEWYGQENSTFSGYASTKFLTSGTPENNALLQNNLKTLLDLHSLIGCSIDQSDLNKAQSLVEKFYKSPVLLGYWVSDDVFPDCPSYGERIKALQALYSMIKSIDLNPDHYVVGGFGAVSKLNAYYANREADVVALYYYRSWEGNNLNRDIQDSISIIKNKTPKGENPPPFIGLYQAFYGTNNYGIYLPNPYSVTDIVTDVKTYMDNGAMGVGVFGWREVDWKYFIYNDPTGTLADTVNAVSAWLKSNSYVGTTSSPGSDFSVNYVPPSANSCKMLGNPTNKNFGDPACDFTLNNLDDFLIKLDPLNASFWFETVAKSESQYEPNAWRSHKLTPQTFDPQGAWGLFQMGSSSPPGQKLNVPGSYHNDVLDRGDENWQRQAYNAVKLNCELFIKSQEWKYWGTATSRWGQNVCNTACIKFNIPNYPVKC